MASTEPQQGSGTLQNKDEAPSISQTRPAALRSSSSQTSISRGGDNSAASSDGESTQDSESPEVWLKRRIESKRRRIEEQIEKFKQEKQEELKAFEKRLLKKYKQKKQKAEQKTHLEMTDEMKARTAENTDRKQMAASKEVEENSSPPFEKELHGIFTPNYLPLLEGSYFNDMDKDKDNAIQPRRRSLSISEHKSTSIYSPSDEIVSGISAGIASRRHSTAGATGVPLPPSLKPRNSFGQTTPRQKSPKRVTFQLDEAMPIPSRSSPTKQEENGVDGQATLTMNADGRDHSDNEVAVRTPQEVGKTHKASSQLEEDTYFYQKQQDEEQDAAAESKAPIMANGKGSQHINESSAPSQVEAYTTALDTTLAGTGNSEMGRDEIAVPFDESDDEDVFDMDESVPMIEHGMEEPLASPRDPFAESESERLPYRRSSISSPLSSQNPALLGSSLPQYFAPGSIRRRSLAKYLADDDGDTDVDPVPVRPPAPASPTKAEPTYNRANPPSSLPISVSAPPLPTSKKYVPSVVNTPLPTPSNKLLNPFSSPKNSPYFSKIAAEVAAQAEAEGTIGVGSVVGGIDGSTGYDEFPESSMVFGSKRNEGGMSFSMKMRLEEEMEKRGYGAK